MCKRTTTEYKYCGCTRYFWQYCDTVKAIDGDSADRYKERCNFWYSEYQNWVVAEDGVFVNPLRGDLRKAGAHHHHKDTFARHGAIVYRNGRPDYLIERLFRNIVRGMKKVGAKVKRKQPQPQRPESPVSVNEPYAPREKAVKEWESRWQH